MEVYSCLTIYGHVILKMPIIKYKRATHLHTPELLMDGAMLLQI